MSGLQVAGYKQISNAVKSDLITSTMAETTCPVSAGWYCAEVLSSGAQLESLTAPGISNASVLDSARTFEKGAKISCASITAIKRSTKDSHGLWMMHRRILI